MSRSIDPQAARAFAEIAHAGQTRDGADARPYVTHVIDVAELVEAWGGDDTAVCAALLHDTVEDCDVTRDDLAARFGPQVADIVLELTDDMSLPKAERKRLQVENAPHKSAHAALVKLADKTSNLRDLVRDTPVHWTRENRLAYVAQAETVVDNLPRAGLPEVGLAAFAQAAQSAKEKDRP